LEPKRLYLVFLAVAFGIVAGGALESWGTTSTTSITLAITSGGRAVTTVASGSVVTLSASVMAGTTAVTTGQVNFCDSSATYCTDIHLLGTAQLTSAGTAAMRFRPAIGSHSYHAIFVGTTTATKTQTASISSSVALTVTGALPTTTTIAATGSVGNYSLKATVSGPGGLAPLAGTVSFLDSTNNNYSLATAALGAVTPGLSFLNSQSPVVGSNPQSIAVGDFNRDGIADLAVANNGSNSVTILSGNGDGTFTQAKNSPVTVGGNPSSVTVGDFNGDGIADLAVANTYTGTVTILMGGGDGTFTPALNSPVSVGNEPFSIAVSDLNRDGIPDLAVANWGSNTVTILLGNGDGTFTPAANSPVSAGIYPDSIAVGDFNRDSIPDLAVVNDNASLMTILLGNGDGTFYAAPSSPVTVGYNSTSVAMGDFNGDGKPDLAVSSFIDSAMTILLGNGDGTFTPATKSPFSAGYNPQSVAVGDFNRDGIADLAVANAGVNPVIILLGNGDGTFTPAANIPVSSANTHQSVAVGDFNADGISDFVVANNDGSNTANVQLSKTTQTASATVTGISLAGVGAHNVEASYAGDATYGASISTTTSLTAQMVTPVVTVTPSASSITTAQPLTVTVAVNGGSGNPTVTGTVILTSGNYTSAASTVSNGSATINVPAGSLRTGSDTLTVNYTPDSSSSSIYNPASGSASVTVSAAAKTTPTVTVTPSASTITTAQPLTVTVAVSGGIGNPTPGGTVMLTGGGYTSGTTNLIAGSATFSIPAGSLATGSHTLTASYTPDTPSSSTYNSATGISSPVTVTQVKITPVMTVTLSPTSITTAQALTVTVAVNGGTGKPTPTGTVVLNSGSYTSAATALSSGSVTINIPAGSLSVGTDTLMASYTPDSNSSSIYNGATATSPAVTVTQAKITPTVTVTPSPSSITTTQAVSVTVGVTGGGGNPTPTGSVTLTSGSYSSSAATLSSGSASINVPAGSLTAGVDSLNANYSGDGNYSAASGTGSVTVTTAVNPSFTIGGTAVSVTPGATTSNTSTVTVTPSGGFTGIVALSAVVTSSPAGAQYPPTLSFGSTTPVSISGTTAGTATLSIATTAATSAAVVHPNRPGVPWYAAGGATLACILLYGIPARRRRWQTMLGMLALFAALSGGMLACGGGSSPNPSPTPATKPGTTAGTYTVTVTGNSGATTATGTITLTVQ
jgi:hypothetical protein